jgi:DNA polymerase-3 subunit gamma/tau
MSEAAADAPRYQSLYRRHRPTRFSEIVGQDHVTTALRNALTHDTVAHAYLFSGPRGTGKTTTARLLAKALNCLDLGTDGEPCLECGNCLAVAAGEFYDLIELDAASNRGVDAMRDLIQNVSLGLGATARRKVYVIDEVHMLTGEASNTLLKTLEEPPEHVVFVLATTEPGKVLPTIRSRTQHFEFTLLSLEQLRGHLSDVLAREGIAADTDAIELVARRAAGSARDALSLLDQAIALGGGALDPGLVAASLGGTGRDARLRILESAAGNDAAGALVALTEALAGGADPRRLADELLATLRDAFVLTASRGRTVPDDSTAEELERLRALGESMGLPAMTRGIDALGQAIVDIRGPAVPDPRLVVEVAVVRLARREAGSVVEGLADRVARLESQIEAMWAGGGPAESPVPTAAVEAAPAPGPKAALGAHLGGRPAPPARTARRREPPSAESLDAAAAESPAAHPAAADLSLDDVIQAWPAVLDALPVPVRSIVDIAQPIEVVDGVVVFGAPKVYLRRVNEKLRAHAEAIRGAFQARLGGAPKLKVVEHQGFFDDVPAGTSSDDIVLDDPIDVDPSASPVTPVDSATRLVEAFDATVVDEPPGS